MDEDDVMWGYGIDTDQTPYTTNQGNHPYQPQDHTPFSHQQTYPVSWRSELSRPNGTLLFGAPIADPAPGGMLAMDQGWQQEGHYFSKIADTPWRAERYESQASDPPSTLCLSDVEPPSPAFEQQSYAWTVASPCPYHSADEDQEHSQAEDYGHLLPEGQAFSHPKGNKPTETSTRRSLPTHRPIQPSAPVPPPRRKHRTRIAPIPDDVRSYRDACILEGRELGLTYGDIRRRYDLPEAESTLRGRCRTLMKSKEQRVRKPVWQEKDVQLLLDTVRDTKKAGSRSKTNKLMVKKNGDVRWKDVAERLEEKGASYPFSASACKKKWEERHVS